MVIKECSGDSKSFTNRNIIRNLHPGNTNKRNTIRKLNSGYVKKYKELDEGVFFFWGSLRHKKKKNTERLKLNE